MPVDDESLGDEPKESQDSSRFTVSSAGSPPSVSSSSSTATAEEFSPSSDDAREERDRNCTANDDAAAAKKPALKIATENVQERHSVHFADADSVFVIEPDARANIDAMWYTGDDARRFSLMLMHDARRMAAALADLPHPSMIHEDEVRECVGMEVRVRFYFYLIVQKFRFHLFCFTC